MVKGKDGFYAKYIKRILDFTLSLIALIVLSPILLLLTVVGAIAMKGNPFFVQKRPGKIDPKTGKERIFSLIKFRTMDNRRDASGNLLSDGERLNVYGRWCRCVSADELPELLNILIGDMSIVGPRPLAVIYLPYYTAEERHRHDIRPGLTGLAQVNGRNSISWEDKFSYDLMYVDEISFFTDVKIIIKTIKKVLVREGIGQGTERPVSLHIARANWISTEYGAQAPLSVLRNGEHSYEHIGQ